MWLSRIRCAGSAIAVMVALGACNSTSNELPPTAELSSDGAATDEDFAATAVGRLAAVREVLSSAGGFAPVTDCNGNGVADLCELDCGAAGGVCDVPGCGTGDDCNTNGLPDACDVADAGNTDEWSSHVIAFTSQFDEDYWSAADAVGTPDTPRYGDLPTAWAPAARNGTIEALTLGFDVPRFADAVTVRETFGNGFVFQIDVVDLNGVPHPVWSGTDDSLPGNPVEFRVDFAATTFLVAGVTVHVDTDHSPTTFEEVDAVALHGSPGGSTDCNLNGVPDECEPDADGDGVPDDCEEHDPNAPDCNSNGVGDDIDLAVGAAADCNGNGVPDVCDLRAATSSDCDADGQPDECAPDIDADGLIDTCDACPDSDLAATVIIDDCDTGVANRDLAGDGCSMSDLIAECRLGAANHGAFVRCVAHLVNNWRRERLITGDERRGIRMCANLGRIPPNATPKDLATGEPTHK